MNSNGEQKTSKLSRLFASLSGRVRGMLSAVGNSVKNVLNANTPIPFSELKEALQKNIKDVGQCAVACRPAEENFKASNLLTENKLSGNLYFFYPTIDRAGILINPSGTEFAYLPGDCMVFDKDQNFVIMPQAAFEKGFGETGTPFVALYGGVRSYHSQNINTRKYKTYVEALSATATAWEAGDHTAELPSMGGKLL